MRKGTHHMNDICWTWGEHREDGAQLRTCVQVSYQWNWVHGCLGSRLVLECLMMKSSALFECGPLSPCVHLTSTRCHLCDKCSQAIPVFRRSSASVYDTEHKPKNRNETLQRGGEQAFFPCSCNTASNQASSFWLTVCVPYRIKNWSPGRTGNEAKHLRVSELGPHQCLS